METSNDGTEQTPTMLHQCQSGCSFAISVGDAFDFMDGKHHQWVLIPALSYVFWLYSSPINVHQISYAYSHQYNLGRNVYNQCASHLMKQSTLSVTDTLLLVYRITATFSLYPSPKALDVVVKLYVHFFY
eukprot:539617_1